MPTGPDAPGKIPELPPDAIAALSRGNRIEAIKCLRNDSRRQLGLKDAKEMVDAYLESQPSLQAAVNTAQSKMNRKALIWLVILIALTIFFWSWGHR